MSTAEADTVATTASQDEKMSVDEQPKEKIEDSKDEEKKEEEKKEEAENKKDEDEEKEERKDVVTPRRSSRINTTSSPVASNGTPAKSKRGGGRAAKKRSAEVLADDDATEGKAKKPKKGEGEEEGLKLGEPLPDIVLKNEQGEDVKTQDLAGNKKGVVIFLVPKADTPGCTIQACGFRDSSAEFTSVDFAVYCLSADAPDKQKKWKDKKSLPFPLLSDPERTLVEKLTGSGKKTARSHFVFAGGKLVDKRIPVKPVDSPRLALEFIKALEIGKTDAPEAVKEPDSADVAAASAAAGAAVETAGQDVTATGASEQTTAESASASANETTAAAS